MISGNCEVVLERYRPPEGLVHEIVERLDGRRVLLAPMTGRQSRNEMDFFGFKEFL
jgi:hypothetical protein